MADFFPGHSQDAIQAIEADREGRRAEGVEIAADATVPEYLRGLSCKREELLKLFATLAANENGIEGACAEEVAKNNNLGFSQAQVYFALKVFLQLALVSFADGRLKIMRGVKSDLKNSAIYNAVMKMQTGQE